MNVMATALPLKSVSRNFLPALLTRLMSGSKSPARNSRIASEALDGLRARGHQVNVIDEWSWIVGGGQGLARDPESGALMAGADPRRDGYALAM